MTEPSVEDIVARLKRTKLGQSPDIRALIASWRERGAMIDAIHAVLDEHDGDDAVGHIRDVLYGGAEI
jgi:hypothetical protein